MTKPMWIPSDKTQQDALMTRFMTEVSDQLLDKPVSNYHELYQWSIEQPEQFWSYLWDFCQVKGTKGETIFKDSDHMLDAQWFPQAELNFTENILQRRDDSEAIVFWGEDKVRQTLTFRELYQAVASMSAALRANGIGVGDCVAGVMPNMPQTIIASLACAAVGAIWTSASPDFGAEGLYDRFSQTQPKCLFSVDGYYYNGKTHLMADKLSSLLGRVDSIETLIMVDYVNQAYPVLHDSTVKFHELLEQYPNEELITQALPFNHPLYILYSSGTTGKPKCIVHGAGGTLLQHLKEHQLHSDIHPGDKVFYFTTCGWMMWNWLVTALASGATLLLYDGSPFYPSGNVLLDFIADEKASFFGTSAKYIDQLEKDGFTPIDTHDFSHLRTMASTGSVLKPESYDYVYQSIKADLNLASISGGTDIISCFMLGCPTEPVYRGQLQVRGLGLAVNVFDTQGNPTSEKGELVCTKAFPNMPIFFWNDDNKARYKKAYFNRFDNVWCHGDFIELTPQKGVIFYGRSDTTLNPGGVRIGTAEIYRQVDTIDEVMQSVVVGLDIENDVQVVLFVQLREGLSLDNELIKTIKLRIRQGCTPRHVPAMVAQVSDIPRTLSGKLSELAVKDTINGNPIGNQDALANPESLAIYEDWREKSLLS